MSLQLYSSLGLHLLRLHGVSPEGNCTCGRLSCTRSAGKHPVLGAWQQGPPEPLPWPEGNWNFGLRMGLQPSGQALVALDVDSPAEFAALQLSLPPLPPTLTTISGRGFHLLFQVPPQLLPLLSNFAKRSGVDLRAEGGQVVAAPSLHYSGVRYQLANEQAGLATLPAEWFAWLAQSKRAPVALTEAPAERNDAWLDLARNHALAEPPDFVGSQQLTWKMALRLVRGYCLRPATALDLLRLYNARSSVPLPDNKLVEKINGAEAPSTYTPWGFAIPSGFLSAQEAAELLAANAAEPAAPEQARVPVPIGRSDLAPAISALRRAPRTRDAAALLEAVKDNKPIANEAVPVAVGALVAQFPKASAESIAAAFEGLAMQLPAAEAEAWRGWVLGLVQAAQAPAPARPGQQAAQVLDATRRLIQVNGQDDFQPIDQDVVNRQAAEALVQLPDLYSRGGMLTEIREATICQLEASGVVRDRLARACSFVQWGAAELENGDSQKRMKKIGPPDWCVSALTAETYLPGAKPLNAILKAPTVRQDGSVLLEQGYDASTGFFLLEQASPDYLQPEQAVAVLRDVFDDFPFADGQTGLAVALAGALTLLARPLLWSLGEPSVSFAIDAGNGGSGKTLLTDCILAVGGEEPRGISWSDDEAELMKRVDSGIFAGDRVLLFNNIRTGGVFGTPALDEYLTSRKTVRSRPLGRSVLTEMPWLCSCFVNGCNFAFAGEAVRRFVRARLELQTRPFKRTEMQLRAHLKANKGLVQSAALSLLSAHLQLQPTQPVLGLEIKTFEGWREIVAGCVVRWFGCDPVASQESMLEIDETAGQVSAALQQLWLLGKAQSSFEARKLRDFLTDPLLANAWTQVVKLRGRRGSSQAPIELLTDVPYAIRGLKDTWFGDYRLRKQEARSALWWVERRG